MSGTQLVKQTLYVLQDHYRDGCPSLLPASSSQTLRVCSGWPPHSPWRALDSPFPHLTCLCCEQTSTSTWGEFAAQMDGYCVWPCGCLAVSRTVLMALILLAVRHAVWELGVSSRSTAGTSGGQTRTTRRATWALSGRSPSQVGAADSMKQSAPLNKALTLSLSSCNTPRQLGSCSCVAAADE